MKTEIVDVSPTRKEIKIEIDAAQVRAEFDRVSQTYASRATVPGFRKGRAPVSVVRQRFKNEIRGDVLSELIPQAVAEAITENKLRIIGEPDIHLENSEGLEKIGEQPLAVHAHVEVFPEVELGDYKGMEVTRRTRPVTEEDVEGTIARLREMSASLQPVEERGAELGDTVTVNFRGKYINPPEAEDINVEEVDVELGGAGVHEAFTENLTGAREGETKTFTVKYPEDFSTSGLAGKEIEYTAEVVAVRRKELPELDDEWAKSMGEEVTTVAELRDRIRQSLTEHSQHEAERRTRDELIEKLSAAHPVAVPEALTEVRLRELMEATIRNMYERGYDPRNPDIKWDSMREVLEKEAEQQVRTALLLEEIAAAEQIEVSDEEVAAEIAEIAQASRQSVEQVRAVLTKEKGERSIAHRLRVRKTLDFLLANARVTEAEWRAEDEDAEDESDQAVAAEAGSEVVAAQPANESRDTSDAEAANAASASEGSEGAQQS